MRQRVIFQLLVCSQKFDSSGTRRCITRFPLLFGIPPSKAEKNGRKAPFHIISGDVSVFLFFLLCTFYPRYTFLCAIAPLSSNHIYGKEQIILLMFLLIIIIIIILICTLLSSFCLFLLLPFSFGAASSWNTSSFVLPTNLQHKSYYHNKKTVQLCFFLYVCT